MIAPGLRPGAENSGRNRPWDRTTRPSRGHQEHKSTTFKKPILHIFSKDNKMKSSIIPMERIQRKIFLVRGQKVMLDRDLAELYEVPTKVLKQSVKRHIDRFPEDFMFVLLHEEFLNWRSQFVTSNSDRMGLRHSPMAFTEQGVAMLSSVLNSPRAIQVNIAVMRAFVQLRSFFSTHADLARKLEELEKKYDAQFRVVFDAIRQLMTPPQPPRKRIGFRVHDRRSRYQIKHRKS
jgi:hypothetical protein